MKPLIMKIWVGVWTMAIGQTPVMTTGRPAGQQPLVVSGSTFLHLHSDDAVFIDEFAIIIANKLDHLIAGIAPVRQGVGHGLLQHHGIFDRDLVVHYVRRKEPEPFSNAHLVTVWHASIAGH